MKTPTKITMANNAIDPIAERLAEDNRLGECWFLRGVVDSIEDLDMQIGARKAGPHARHYLAGYRACSAAAGA